MFMQNLHYTIRSTILAIIDFFYMPFRRLMPLQTFRYAACGGGNTVLNFVIYTFLERFIFHDKVQHFGAFAFSSHITALFIAFLITFPIGFYLNMFVVFQGSYLRKRVQLFRFFLVSMICLVLNSVLLSLFVKVFGWDEIISQAVSTGLLIIFSYISQRHFSFRIKKITYHAE